jgi:hypothetical protein
MIFKTFGVGKKAWRLGRYVDRKRKERGLEERSCELSQNRNKGNQVKRRNMKSR